MEKVNVLLADNHLLIREGIKAMLANHPTFTIVGEVDAGHHLTEALARYRPHLVIIDYHLPGFFSKQDIERIYQLSPGTRVLVVTTNQNKNDILQVLEYGVNNYILKLCDKEEFVNAVYATIKKERFFCGKVIDAVLEKHFPKDQHCEAASLSDREIEIVRLISEGYTDPMIAEKLYLSPHTVKTHRRNILKKLGLKKSAELVAFAIKAGLLEGHTNR